MGYEVHLAATMQTPSFAFNQTVVVPEGVVAFRQLPADSQIGMTVSVPDDVTGDPIEAGVALANKMVNRMAVGTRSFVGSPRLSHCTNGTHVIRPDTGLSLIDATKQIRRTERPLLNEQLNEFLSSDHGPGEKYYVLLRLAYEEADVIASFMILYMILLNVFDEDFAKVDAFIKSREPHVEMRAGKRRRKGTGQDTVYTSLRHDVGHSRSLDLVTVRKQMREHLPGLRKLTLAALDSLR